MRFFFRAIIGFFLFGLVLSFLGVAVISVNDALKTRAEKNSKNRFAKERTYNAYVDKLKSSKFVPKITAYGEAKSWRSLELRTASSGRLIFLAESFREGGQIQKNDLLFKIDPSQAEDLFEFAKVNLAEAKAELKEANLALVLVIDDRNAAKQQLKLRESALTRQKSLKTSGIVTKTSVENAELLLSNAQQILVGRENALAQGRFRIEKASVALERAKISFEQAKRQLKETEYRAPFSGIISKVSVAPGRLLNRNEQLGVLIDPKAIEVEFQVSNQEFSRLVDSNGDILRLPIKVKLELNNLSIERSGLIQRSGGEVVQGASGRQIFASLDGLRGSGIRPGDFLLVEIEESELSGVAIIPSSSADSNGNIFLVGKEDRLEEYKSEILRRQGDFIILENVPFGREYVSQRAPQLDVGLRINPIRIDEKSNSISSLEKPDKSEEKLVAITKEQREKLIEFVNNNKRIPKDVRKGIIAQLQREKVSSKLVSRFEKRMEGR